MSIFHDEDFKTLRFNATVLKVFKNFTKIEKVYFWKPMVWFLIGLDYGNVKTFYCNLKIDIL